MQLKSSVNLHAPGLNREGSEVHCVGLKQFRLVLLREQLGAYHKSIMRENCISDSEHNLPSSPQITDLRIALVDKGSDSIGPIEVLTWQACLKQTGLPE